MKNVMDLIYKVSAGNPGAMAVLKELEWFTYFYEMLDFLLKKGIIGSNLWILYKDVYHMDSNKLGKYLEEEMYKDREFEHLQNLQANKPPLRFMKFTK